MSTPSQSMPQAARERAGWQSVRLPFGLSITTLMLSAIVLLAAALRLANIGAIGVANSYYTAAVASMLQSWHNFFFVAAEPGASVSVDKPPVGLWLEAISAYVLGVSGFAVVLPQILSGIGAVILLFYLVRRWFGAAAGLLAALALAITPVGIAVDRNNTPDASLIFTLLLTAWAFIKATETRRLRWLLLGAALLGVGFNIKMLQAFLPLPALYALYFFGSEQGWWRKIAHLSLATLLLIPVSLSWALIVDLTPADQRPYVGSSQNNSALNLIIGYNGLQRLLGGGPGGPPPGPGNSNDGPPAPPPFPGANTPQGDGSPMGGPGGPGGPGGIFGTGAPGPLRLFQSGLAAQMSWLLPFGLILIVAMAASVSWRRPQTELHRGLLLWGGWLLTCVVFFSVAGFFHQYYLAMLGAPLAAIVAMGMRFLWRLRLTDPLRAALLLLVAAIVTLAFQVYAVAMYQVLDWWLALPLALAALGVALLLLSLRRNSVRLPRLGFALITAAIMIVPGVWSGFTTAYADTGSPLTQAYNGKLPLPGIPGGIGVPGQLPTNQRLLSYLQANTQGVYYLMVVPSAIQGAPYVLATRRPVLYAGGFSDSDPVIDRDDLARLVAEGKLRYVLWLAESIGGPGGSNPNSAGINSYLQTACSIVDPGSVGLESGTQQRNDRSGPFEQPLMLYRCGG
jgi:4-amino-4-deoxy-L-arabinose transferase-like glycosyltransferase